jgi:cobalt/nickel transport system ATP-binding protein
MEPEILISDELLASLDPWVRLRILDIFARLRERGKTVIAATHDFKVVHRWASYVIVMDAGRAVFAGTPDQLLADQDLLTQTGLAQVWDGEI